MDKQRNVFLFGAGAVIDWGGPKTICSGDKLTLHPDRNTGVADKKVCCLTHLITNFNFSTKSGKKITQSIVDVLVQNGFNEKDINFETIINVIEELIIYFSKFSNTQATSLLPAFLERKNVLDDLLNYEIVEGGLINTKRLKIPGRNYEERYRFNQNDSSEQVFLQTVMIELLDQICGEVSEYSFYTANATQLVESKINKPLNDGFHKWINDIAERNGVIRMYTMNYDRIFKIILENRGIRVFEGFECGATLGPDDEIPPNIQRILSDFNSHVHYNLHGSAYWDINALNANQLPTSEFLLTGAPHFLSNQIEQSIRQIDKGKNTLLTNIITGHQKTARTAITPFKQMLSAFDKDCFFANRLYIVGYGFGDEHINESIKTALIHNNNLKITIIDPGFDNNKLGNKLAIELFSNSHTPLAPKSNTDNHKSFLNGKVEVYIRKFSDVLNSFIEF